MFTSIMRVLHEQLPCSRNFFSMKRKYRSKQFVKGTFSETKIKEIARPRMVRGLSMSKSPTRKNSSLSCSSRGS